MIRQALMMFYNAVPTLTFLGCGTYLVTQGGVACPMGVGCILYAMVESMNLPVMAEIRRESDDAP